MYETKIYKVTNNFYDYEAKGSGMIGISVAKSVS
jgi:hypothetical protein